MVWLTLLWQDQQPLHRLAQPSQPVLQAPVVHIINLIDLRAIR